MCDVCGSRGGRGDKVCVRCVICDVWRGDKVCVSCVICVDREGVEGIRCV